MVNEAADSIINKFVIHSGKQERINQFLGNKLSNYSNNEEINECIFYLKNEVFVFILAMSHDSQ